MNSYALARNSVAECVSQIERVEHNINIDTVIILCKRIMYFFFIKNHASIFHKQNSIQEIKFRNMSARTKIY